MFFPVKVCDAGYFSCKCLFVSVMSFVVIVSYQLWYSWQSFHDSILIRLRGVFWCVVRRL